MFTSLDMFILVVFDSYTPPLKVTKIVRGSFLSSANCLSGDFHLLQSECWIMMQEVQQSNSTVDIIFFID